MASTPLQIDFETPESSIFSNCDAAGLKWKEAEEVYHSLDAVRFWRDRFEKQFGKLFNCVHHSNPDDPPDLILNFATAPVMLNTLG